MIIPFAKWPTWLQMLVVAPHGILAAISLYWWWPKSEREWRRFGFVLAYLVVFYLVMRYVFAFK